MPVNEWVESIDITPWIKKYSEIDDCTEEGMRQLREVRDGVVATLKTLTGYRSRAQLNAMTREEKGQFLNLYFLVKDVEEAESVYSFDFHMKYVYAWADEERVWLSGE